MYLFYNYFYACLGFLRKVYGILTSQLLITVIIATACISLPQLKGFVQSRLVPQRGRKNVPWFVFYMLHECHIHTYSPVFNFALLIGTLVVLVALMFKKEEAPANYILLLTFVSYYGTSFFCSILTNLTVSSNLGRRYLKVSLLVPW